MHLALLLVMRMTASIAAFPRVDRLYLGISEHVPGSWKVFEGRQCVAPLVTLREGTRQP